MQPWLAAGWQGRPTTAGYVMCDLSFGSQPWLAVLAAEDCLCWGRDAQLLCPYSLTGHPASLWKMTNFNLFGIMPIFLANHFSHNDIYEDGEEVYIQHGISWTRYWILIAFHFCRLTTRNEHMNYLPNGMDKFMQTLQPLDPPFRIPQPWFEEHFDKLEERSTHSAFCIVWAHIRLW